MRKQVAWVSLVIVLMVLLDQCVKVYIKTHFALGEAHEITSWFWICYVENPGMAFGIEWFDKLALTLFRLVAVGALGWYIHRLIHTAGTKLGYLLTIALVIAGALGNIIDCVFYGPIFGDAPWFYGKVVDMLYFPLITNAEGECLFFQPVFNIADSCITCAVIAVLIWFRKDLDESLTQK